MLVNRLTGNPDCDDVLNWLEVHSLSLRQGLPLQVLHTRWAQAGRMAGALNAALQQLMQDKWIMLTPGLEPVHIRFTSEGFGRLLEAAPSEPESAAQPVTMPPAPAIDPVRIANLQISESRLRNDILAVYRDLRLKADSRLIGVTLSRYWQESGHRAGDLRTGIDVLLRDGYIEKCMVGIELHWTLTTDGAFFINAPETPERLLRLAPKLGKIVKADAPGELRRLTAGLLYELQVRSGEALDYETIRPEWLARLQHDENALLHGLDLAFKSGYLSIGDGPNAPIVMTEKGEEAGAAAGRTASGLLGKIVRALS